MYKSSNENTNDSNLSKNPEFLSSYTESFSSIQTQLTKSDAQKFKIPIDNLKFGHVLGSGAFGIVIYAEIYTNKDENGKNITTKQPVAIKKLRG